MRQSWRWTLFASVVMSENLAAVRETPSPLRPTDVDHQPTPATFRLKCGRNERLSPMTGANSYQITQPR